MYQRLTSTSVYLTLSVPLKHVHVKHQRALYSKNLLDGCLRNIFRIVMVRFDVFAIQYPRVHDERGMMMDGTFRRTVLHVHPTTRATGAA
jgi:hypothetical protein